jgi:hypothetical protein
MTVELRCRQCGARFVPSRDDLLKGPRVYHYCPPCRPPAPARTP